jgi:class 3 adenylate cyclase/pimeloyl-ACP methyl ester carboxylesterase
MVLIMSAGQALDREVGYCITSDGVRIAYSLDGHGPPLLICPQFIESFSLAFMLPPQEAFLRRLGEGRTAIRFDPRGVGLSQREVTAIPFAGLVEDLRAVIQAADLGPSAIFAPTSSGTRSIALAAEHPELVSALVLYGAYPRISEVLPGQALVGLATLARTNWAMAARAFADVGSARDEASQETAPLGEIFAQSVTGEIAALAMEGSADVDVYDLLPSLKVRTLVVHRINDSFAAPAIGQKMASMIPGARLLTPPGTIHGYWLGDTDAVLHGITSFLDERPETRATTNAEPENHAIPGTFRTILFTDLVGHTEMMRRLGDAKGREVLRKHEDITREVLKTHGGTEVKTMGDGFLASFGSVAKAVECAISLQRAMAQHNAGAAEPLHVRVGLNAGEPIEDEGDLFGSTVILASRIAAKAEGGEILVANAVRELCSGKGFLFSDRGDFVAKGFEEPVRIFEVSWRS